VVAPAAVSVVLAPLQMLDVEAESVTVGFALTVTVVEAVPLQPFDVPVTMYVVVPVGLTVCGFEDPLLHVYVVPPAAVSTVLVPLHILFEEALRVTVGIALTVSVVEVAFPTHPYVLVPVTVYVVVTVGTTVCVVPVPLLLHAYVDAPPAVSTALEPLHRDVGDDVSVTVGSGLTVMVCDATVVHPPVAEVPVTV